MKFNIKKITFYISIGINIAFVFFCILSNYIYFDFTNPSTVVINLINLITSIQAGTYSAIAAMASSFTAFLSFLISRKNFQFIKEKNQEEKLEKQKESTKYKFRKIILDSRLSAIDKFHISISNSLSSLIRDLNKSKKNLHLKRVVQSFSTLYSSSLKDFRKEFLDFLIEIDYELGESISTKLDTVQDEIFEYLSDELQTIENQNKKNKTVNKIERKILAILDKQRHDIIHEILRFEP